MVRPGGEVHSRIGLLYGSPPGAHPVCPNPRTCALQVLVRDNNVDQALRVLKKKMQREGILREMRLRKAYPSLRASGRALVKRGASALA
jgi:pentatricopeptide repeat protein